jgi:hypothetical protein
VLVETVFRDDEVSTKEQAFGASGVLGRWITRLRTDHACHKPSASEPVRLSTMSFDHQGYWKPARRYDLPLMIALRTSEHNEGK